MLRSVRLSSLKDVLALQIGPILLPELSKDTLGPSPSWRVSKSNCCGERGTGCQGHSNSQDSDQLNCCSYSTIFIRRIRIHQDKLAGRAPSGQAAIEGSATCQCRRPRYVSQL
mmetsp:Transcript_5316/g.19452  ORF Transcript_5316/g.19452 Transcript_5316/m.19452 type:complete len:113 (+) Transcript_5316:161-499(+)